MNDIKARMKSVKSTMQITKAMELVATSKLRRAKERAERARPYSELLRSAVLECFSADGFAETDWGKTKSDGTLIIAIAGDRGLAGGYNANVFRTAAALPEASGSVTFLPIGKKAHDYYQRRDVKLLLQEPLTVSELGVGGCMALGKKIAEHIKSGDFGRVILVYTFFKSMISQIPKAELIFPLGGDEPKKLDTGDPLLAEEPDEFLNRVMPSYLGGALWCAVSEASASESGARRTAMNSANKNAEEMIDDLMLRFNRARQSVITQEITEIVSGAEAL